MTVIAIDGPAASGKGTLARRIAERLGYAWLDTGLLYRAAALAAVDGGFDPADPAAAATAAANLSHAIAKDGPAVLADPRLRGDDIAVAASKLSAVPAARAALLDLQRDFAARPRGGRETRPGGRSGRARYRHGRLPGCAGEAVRHGCGRGKGAPPGQRVARARPDSYIRRRP